MKCLVWGGVGGGWGGVKKAIFRPQERKRGLGEKTTPDTVMRKLRKRSDAGGQGSTRGLRQGRTTRYSGNLGRQGMKKKKCEYLLIAARGPGAKSVGGKNEKLNPKCEWRTKSDKRISGIRTRFGKKEFEDARSKTTTRKNNAAK